MKIRSDFVTNSSSSSFIVINIQSQKLKEVLEKYKDILAELAEYCCCELDISDGLSINEDETGYCSDIPDSIDDVVNSIISLIESFQDMCDDDNADILDSIIDDLQNNQEIIKNDITLVEWTYGDIGWGGDSDARYEPSNYDEETLDGIYEAIMAKCGYTSRNQITEYDFNIYVGEFSSNEEDTFTFNKETGDSTRYHTFELL